MCYLVTEDINAFISVITLVFLRDLQLSPVEFYLLVEFHISSLESTGVFTKFRLILSLYKKKHSKQQASITAHGIILTVP